jgi:peptidoglycan/xylan/chitin deacetylase (PgdA/CDA1 family)
MPIERVVKDIASSLDGRLAAAAESIRLARSVLLVFTFHSLFSCSEEIANGVMDPQQKITIGKFRSFVADFHEHGYRFVSPREVMDGLRPSAGYAMITFDDGYYNNVRALPVLEEYQTPAVLCISTNHVLAGKAFWWDVLYREARKQGWSNAECNRVRRDFKRMRTCDIEAQLVSEFGKESVRPVSDIDRPMTPEELGLVARHPLVHIGNHTSDHAILSNYSGSEVAEQMCGAQDTLCEITGKVPQLIAYPNGNVSREIVQTARTVGLALGVTVQPGRNRIRKSGYLRTPLELKRFTLLGDRDIQKQCRVARSPLALQTGLAAIRLRCAKALA